MDVADGKVGGGRGVEIPVGGCGVFEEDGSDTVCVGGRAGGLYNG